MKAFEHDVKSGAFGAHPSPGLAVLAGQLPQKGRKNCIACPGIVAEGFFPSWANRRPGTCIPGRIYLPQLQSTEDSHGICLCELCSKGLLVFIYSGQTPDALTPRPRSSGAIETDTTTAG